MENAGAKNPGPKNPGLRNPGLRNLKPHASLAVAAAYCFLPLLLVGVALRGVEHAARQSAASPDAAGAAAAFAAIVPMLRDPRCMNCHSAGDFSCQGDDSHRHTMQAGRGPNGQ